MSQNTKVESKGFISQIIGAVIDVTFTEGHVPNIYDALVVDETGLTLEVQQVKDSVARMIAMGSTDGLKRSLNFFNFTANYEKTTCNRTKRFSRCW